MNRKGMTLVEVVVSMAIIAIAGVGFVYVFTSGAKLFGRAAKIENDQYSTREYAEKITEAGGSQLVNRQDVVYNIGDIQVSTSKVTVTSGDDSSVEYSYYDNE